MTERIEKLIKQLKSKEYKKLRRVEEEPGMEELYTLDGYVKIFKAFIEKETPIIHQGDNFGFNISVSYKPGQLSGNYTPNYYRVLTCGLDEIRREVVEKVSKEECEEKIQFGKAMLECLDVFLKLCEDYRKLAEKQGNKQLYAALCKVPHKGAESFYEACVFMKICIYFLRAGFTNHLGLGRFDQYMYPFYKRDKENGKTNEELLEVLEEFFISLNKDTDLYRGVQQGDNGQSMVIGGFDKNGNSMFNELSRLCMEASLELNLIDPKINLRVGKNTSDEIYELGTRLTQKGLGFP